MDKRSVSCHVCGGNGNVKVTGMRQQHANPADCISRLLWKLEQAEIALERSSR